MTLNYLTELQDIETNSGTSCIDDNYRSTEGTAYRFVHEKIENPINWMPVALLRNITKPKCEHWSLSFYNDAIKAVSAHQKLQTKMKNIKPNLPKSIGDYLAVGNFETAHGLMGLCNNEGHFECFTNNNVNFPDTFKIIKKLV